MLALTKKTEYALIAIRYLAERPNQTVSAREIAEAYGMPGALVMNILKTLHHASLLSSTRGTKGGYRLIAELDNVSVRDLIGVLEGPVQLVECAGLSTACAQPQVGSFNCKVGPGVCPIQPAVHALHEQIVGVLSKVKLSEVLALTKANVPVQATVAAEPQPATT